MKIQSRRQLAVSGQTIVGVNTVKLCGDDHAAQWEESLQL
jgi:hypothetical protein